jgi:hypothetical protein
LNFVASIPPRLLFVRENKRLKVLPPRYENDDWPLICTLGEDGVIQLSPIRFYRQTNGVAAWVARVPLRRCKIILAMSIFRSKCKPGEARPDKRDGHQIATSYSG